MTDFDLRALLVSLLSEETERDQQRLVGASNLSNPCTRCLAHDMYGMIDPSAPVAPRGRYYLGAVIGTFVHLGLQERAEQRPELEPEMRVVVGEIPGYGVIKSTTDLYYQLYAAMVDWKTTTIEKLKTYKQVPKIEESEYDTDLLAKARLTMKQYRVQLNLYGKGIEDSGRPVKTISIGFIPRDAKQESDLWTYTEPYQRSIAEAALDRATRIWQALEQGRKPEDFKSHLLCYQCSVGRTEVDL